jgi:hypothetical protein
MQIDRKVVEQALDYIDKVDYGPYDNRSIITALKAALSQPEDKSQAAFEHWVETVEATQGCAISRNAVADAGSIIKPEIKGHNAEPVAWMVYTQDGKSVCVTDNPADFTDEHRALPLYTHPPRQWHGLTDEERGYFRACGFVGVSRVEEVLRAKNSV